MTGHLFLCGLTPAQRTAYKGGRELQLHGPKKNVRLRMDDIRRRLFKVEPELLTDLVEIATYAFAADTLVSRGGDMFKNMGEKWRRKFRLVIAVRRPGIWKEPQHLHALCDALQFLSDDSWAFEFLPLEDPPSIQGYLSFAEAAAGRAGGATIVLFSGGLDSFAGVVHELCANNRHVVLLSRRISPMTDGRQRELADGLKLHHPGRITHVSVSAGLTNETRAVEYTQRTRSLLLAAMALVAAAIERTDRIGFYENGIMSINLPISTQVVGARSSRSTHPLSLLLLQNLCALILREDVAIENPFVWKTKVEIVEELRERPEGAAIGRTLSCSHTRQMARAKPHCGKCAQCLHRRIATLGANAAEADPAEDYLVDLLLGPRQPGVHRAMAVDIVRSALEFRRLSQDGFARRFASEFAWLMMGFPGRTSDEVAQRSVSMFRRHGETVRTIFTEAAAAHAGDLVDHTLPDSCLLQIAVSSAEINIDENHIASWPPEVSEEDVEKEGPAGDLTLLAVDDVGKRILFDEIAPLTAPGEFRLMAVLIGLHRQDLEAERAPANYRTISADDLAEATGASGDTAGRQEIFRLRKKIIAEFEKLYGSRLELNAVIENVHGKGYRLNPKMRVVSPDQLRRH